MITDVTEEEILIVDEENVVFDSPQNSEWVVAVDLGGMISILKAPNIHYSFFDNGTSAEDIGFSPDIDLDPGVYLFICNCEGGYDEYAQDYYGPYFYPTKTELLYSV